LTKIAAMSSIGDDFSYISTDTEWSFLETRQILTI